MGKQLSLPKIITSWAMINFFDTLFYSITTTSSVLLVEAYHHSEFVAETGMQIEARQPSTIMSRMVSRIMGRAKKLARSRLGLKTCVSSPCFSLCFFTLLSMIYKGLQQPDTNNLTIIPSYTDNGHPTCQQCRHIITTTTPNKGSSSRGLRLMVSQAPGMCFS